MESKINIVDLHLDFLVLIYEQLDEFADKANLARAHTKLWNAFVYHSRKDVRKEICFSITEDETTLTHWRFVLEWCASNVTSIIYPYHSISTHYNIIDPGDLIETAAKFCPNLKHIEFFFKKNNLVKIEENISKLLQLEDIEMNYDGSFKIYPYSEKHWLENLEIDLSNIIGSLQKLTNLRKLQLGIYFLNKNERIQLNKLTQLELLEIGRLEVDHVNDISNMLGNLRTLTIKYYPDTETLRELSKYCTLLEYLTLTDYGERLFFGRMYSNEIPYFPNLKSLFAVNGYSNDEFINNLDSQYNDHLQILKTPCVSLNSVDIDRIFEFKVLKKLFCTDIPTSSVARLAKMPLEEIHFRDSYLTQDDILQLVRKCETLRHLYICSNDEIDYKFICQMLNILEDKGVNPDRPFVFSYEVPEDEERTVDELIFESIKLQFSSNPKSKLMDLRLIKST